MRDYVWSPRGGYLAFSLTDETGFSSVHVWERAGGTLRQVTSDLFHEWNPAWDPDGEYLYYLSDRSFTPQLGSFEWNYLVDRETGIYALALRTDVAHPLPPESDEVTVEAEDEADDGDDAVDAASGDAGDDEPIRIDFDGLARRVVRLPVAFDNYVGLSAGHDRVFFIRTGAQFYGRGGDVPTEVRTFSFEDRETETLAAGAGGYAVSRDPGEGAGDDRGAVRIARRLGSGRPADDLDGGADGGSRPRGGVGADIRRGVAAVPRLLLRRQHARL